MRISFVNPGTTRLPGGGTRVVYEHANQLVARGHEVNIVCPRAIEPPPRSLRARVEQAREWYYARCSASIRMRLGRSALRWLRVDPKVKFCFVPNLDTRFIPDADAVFATWWRTAEYVLAYPACKGEKFYLIQHYETWGGPKDRVDATWKAPLNKVVISHWLYDIGVSMGVSGLRYIPHGIDHAQFRITIPPANRDMSVLSMFSTTEFKRTEDALQVLARFHGRYPNVSITMFGVSPRRRALPTWIRYFRNPSQKYLRELYNRHAVYLAASRAEGWSLPPAEAMACGCVFVGTDSGGCRDYALDGRTALLSPPGHRDALFTNLCRIAEDRELRARLQRTGTECIQRFTWSRSGEMLQQYLAEIVDGAGFSAAATQ